MATVEKLAQERTDLTPEQIERLQAVVSEWPLIADLGMSDLVLWIPTWNDGGLIAVAQVRPTTAPTMVPLDVVGEFAPKGRYPNLDQARAFCHPVENGFPIQLAGSVIGVVSRHNSPQPRVSGGLEEIYQQTATDLLAMLVDGTFPSHGVLDQFPDSPRVGDGLLRLDSQGMVAYASPNAVSALRKLGVVTEVVGVELKSMVMRLLHRPSPLNDELMRIASGQTSGRTDIENTSATVLLQGIALEAQGTNVGAVVLLRDVTEMRRRERLLISKDATIREIHHRVKNNLQTVAALLRLQGRRAESQETKAALGEAEVRVGAIAVVHEILSRDPGETVAFDEIVDRIIGLMNELAPAYSSRVPAISRIGSCGALPSDQATPLAMSVSELLQNAVEHAGASTISVALLQGIERVRVVITDDGRGLPPGFDVAAAGLGLQIVESLMTGELRGVFELEENPGSGLRAIVDIPLCR